MYQPGKVIRYTGISAPRTIQLMAEQSRKAAERDFMMEFALDHSLDADMVSLYRMCRELFFATRYEADPPGKQWIRTPERTFRDGLANCVDYTVFIGSFCKLAGIPCTFRMVSFTSPGAFVHVFPVVANYPLDLVMGQPQDGDKEKPRNFVFGKTLPYLYSKDLKLK